MCARSSNDSSEISRTSSYAQRRSMRSCSPSPPSIPMELCAFSTGTPIVLFISTRRMSERSIYWTATRSHC
ncbi:hypothetical protein PFISCL1PPCAC_24696 [Pristionchus fissidentatus]|uniref:Uncharacterized protein n=1 Tax=Pristionchus fissidentatus TaxID=1538716 RepID=A0AAV5WUR4_9BILA|nr:hypothetical protein PFISCL1PPCAC_8524 [Pristionchus fissidentatus]GMT23306.1 hypothetical protein PFISCL1PPCAC_14603 [Pristionchus fissidentatus]GMT23768.1 hypothetical protein PFISCL1PPCAC_15065 [Pristionchus fissidentatus]GMT30341.1 hypothetical protein PFISCL1PPCAC_21638 [Pristionchus fissidentatus]GMT30343.1 hypothetical protein PFISCL1PPCAC_21640 [Pristionchus fissidentatus]